MYTLITGATSAKAHKLKNKLKADAIILGDYLDLPSFMLASANIIRLPNPESLSYTHEMLTLCLDKGIDAVYPLYDNEVTLLNQAELLFGEYGIKIMKQNNELMNQ